MDKHGRRKFRGLPAPTHLHAERVLVVVEVMPTASAVLHVENLFSHLLVSHVCFPAWQVLADAYDSTGSLAAPSASHLGQLEAGPSPPHLRAQRGVRRCAALAA